MTMQGELAVTAEEKRLWDKFSKLGCIACRKDGIFNPVVSMHHIDGRTKPGSHGKVLPLCAGHHQDGTGMPGLLAVHPWKRKFEKRYGRQLELLALCLELTGCELPKINTKPYSPAKPAAKRGKKSSQKPKKKIPARPMANRPFPQGKRKLPTRKLRSTPLEDSTKEK